MITFNLPPLRERVEDIPKLIEFFLEALGVRYNRRNLKLSESAMQQLREHDWHGNVRELKNTLERAVALSSGDMIDEIFGLVSQTFESDLRVKSFTNTKQPLAEVQKQHILEVLSSVGGKREKAASILGITSRTLYRKLKEYNRSA